MQLKNILILSLLSLSTCFAAPNKKGEYFFDVYRSYQVSKSELIKSFHPQFQRIADLYADREHYKTHTAEIAKILTSVANEIVKMGNFSYFYMAPILYSNKPGVYIQLDLVDKIDAYRASGFLPKPDKTLADPYDLIATWKEYEKIGFDAFMKRRKINENCSAFHCMYGFNLPELKKYEPIFNSDVPKAKTELIQILNNEKDDSKRGTAVLLLAHIKDGNELIRILLPRLRDPSEQVRNNIMRVLGMMLIKDKVKNLDFPIQKIVKALDYPSILDRNKALMILMPLSKKPMYAKYILQHASIQLMDELKQSQENVHSLAYAILQNISHKNYGDRDYKAWETWLKQAKKV